MNKRRILLVGGGHAHVAVLADWIKRGAPCEATLLTPYPTLRYSGMVPGWIAGECDRDAGLVDLAGLARRAGAELVLDRCVEIDPVRSVVTTQNGKEIAFDLASLDTGGVGRAADMLGKDPRILDVRPIDGFVERIGEWTGSVQGPQRIAVIGGGAAGVEIAFALRNSKRLDPKADVTVVSGDEGLLPCSAVSVSNRVRAEFARQSIHLIEANAALSDGVLVARDKPLGSVDLIVAALGSAAPRTMQMHGLDRDENGFVAVDQFQRSMSHPHILASGDVASRMDREVAHSGVHAVHTGPVLAANLRAMAADKPPARSYSPRPASLYLLSTGDGGAIASYGPLAAQGRWVGKLKRWIDKRWIDTYARLASGA